MNNFKIGEYYKVTNPDDWPSRRGVEDRVGVVTSLQYNDNRCELDILPGCYWDDYELTLVEKTMENIQKDDKIYQKSYRSEQTYTVLVRINDVVLLSENDDAETAGTWFHVKELEEDYYLKSEEDVEELTVADVEKALGKKVKIVKG